MSEELQNQTDEAYLAQHPNAVVDADKAHTLASAGDRLESASAELRTEMITNLGQTAYEGGYHSDETAKAEKAVETIEHNNRITSTIYAQHAAAYDKLQATKR